MENILRRKLEEVDKLNRSNNIKSWVKLGLYGFGLGFCLVGAIDARVRIGWHSCNQEVIDKIGQELIK